MEQGLLRTRLASLASRHPGLAQVWSAAAPVDGVAFTTDGAWVVGLAARSEHSSLGCTDQISRVQAAEQPRGRCRGHSAGKTLADCQQYRQHTRLRNHITGEQVQSFAHDTPVSRAFVIANSQHVFTLDEDQTPRVWKAGAGRVRAGLRDVDEIFDTAFDGESVTLLIKSPGNKLALWDSPGRFKRRVVFDKHNAVAAEMSADRRYVLAVDDDALAAVWDSKTGRQVTSLGDWQGVDKASA
ncbi:MAG: hypothetical protein U5R30_15950 [Deltaproteobacteria bacterium]|nr:hypothetical protein [Deltaproteobacteria bacterium]